MAYGGVPAGPLSAYLGVREGNRQAGLQELQGATQIQGMLAKAQAQQMDAQFRQAIEQLGPNPDPQQAAAIAMRFGKPDLAVQFANQVEQRKLRETLAGQTDVTRRDLATQQETMRRDLAARDEALRRQLGGQTDQTRRDIAAQTDATRRELAARDEALRRDLASGKGPTEGERISSGYANRMIASEKIMEGLTDPKLTKQPITGKPGVVESMAATVPLVGQLGSNVARSAQRQKYRQAQEDWVRAKLRKESGAVIADDEMDREIRVYFPQLADSPAVIQQKKNSRKVAQDAMIQAAGRGLSGPGNAPTVLKFDASGNQLP